MFQKTLKNEIRFFGRGLHTGAECGVRLCPPVLARANTANTLHTQSVQKRCSASGSAEWGPRAFASSGIVFYREDMPDTPIPASWRYVLDTANHVTLGRDGASVRTVEHLLSALAAGGVDVCDIFVSGPEAPLLDGAAAAFLEGIRGAGLEELPLPRETFRLPRPVWVDEGDRYSIALPVSDDEFRVSCSIYFPCTAIGYQACHFRVDEETYRREIAGARTFCLEEDVAKLRERGLALGGDFASVLVYGKDGPVGTEPRYEDECVRHKALDLIGDLCLLGRPLAAHIIGHKIGHTLSLELVRRIAGTMEEMA